MFVIIIMQILPIVAFFMAYNRFSKMYNEKLDTRMLGFQDLGEDTNNREYKARMVEAKNSSFIFKRAIPAELYGRDDRPADYTKEEDDKYQNFLKNFRKMAILERLSAPVSEAQKMQFIDEHYLEIFGRGHITGIQHDMLFRGFEEFGEFNPIEDSWGI